MILSGYILEITRPPCLPGAQSVHIKLNLKDDIGEVIPYLNALHPDSEYFPETNELMIMHYGRMIKIEPTAIFINAIHDEEEARKISDWIMVEINQTWEEKDSITPKTDRWGKPQVIKILKLLPLANCGKCHNPTCMVFASRLASGTAWVEQCDELTNEKKIKLQEYLKPFKIFEEE